MGKVFYILFVLFIISLLIFSGSSYEALDYIEKTKKQMKKVVGTHIILENDTLLVVDYSLWKGTFKLSNGIEVSKELLLRNNKRKQK